MHPTGPKPSRKPDNLLRRVAEALRQAGIAATGALLVRVSGGPDSVCLIHVLSRLRSDLGLKLFVVHVDHMLRGPESDADASYVAELARSLDLHVTIERRDAKTHRAEHGCSLEEAAREVRYGAFAELGETVATGHTADDQVETILMHIIRGAGLNGLVGLKPASVWRSAFGETRIKVVRPLLGVTRAETEAYCATHDLKPRLDSTNRSLSPLRNRIRLELLPLLHGYNPDIDAALRRLSAVAAEEVSFLDGSISQVWEQVVKSETDRLVIDTAAFRRLPPAVQRHLIRRALAEMLGDVRDIESIHIESAVDLLNGPAGKRISLPDSLALSVGYGSAALSKGAGVGCDMPQLTGEHRLKIPGEILLPGWRVTALIVPNGEGVEQPNGYQAALDADVAGAHLVVRARRPGERFQPLGLSQPKKLQDFMVDAKVPVACRSKVPLVCSPDEVLWVVGWRIAETAKVTDSTRKVLLLEFEKA